MVGYEKKAIADGFRFIFGIDEAGRGPLAGPVVAAAVYLHSSRPRFKTTINDSKQMTARSREAAFHEILDHAVVGVGAVSETAIDHINILNASHHAMEFAVLHLVRRMPAELTTSRDFRRHVMLLVDGNIFRSKLPYSYRTIINGDAKCLSIACASIIAKVIRDRMMDHYDRVFPQYGFKQHKGYPTQEHRAAIREHGACRLHRKSFTLL